MHPELLAQIVELMGKIVSTEGIEPDAKKVAQNVLFKALNLIDTNISRIHSKEVSGIIS
jgi:hypothetical protein